ncbi:hypothetical protein ASG73_08320 [Janibacter sp. Soil728]|uniref:hypothetical protein n=1 Tax=Janibacter sp. Soil728 TaxID=1736393 RepID=UPI0006F6522D|nr:hypothetical protein [Janibacter sp. Soil728]KRE37652.1 hypothetical protein ASG73_08320 [Janibacter sp. Soil728]
MLRSSTLAKVARAETVAADFGGVLSRRQLTDLGLHRDVVARLVRDHRWALSGTRSVATHCGQLEPSGLRWRAVHEVGGDALVDGVSSLTAAGLTGIGDDVVHVSVHMSMRSPVIAGVRVHKVSRRLTGEGMPAGVPRTRPSLAALRAAQWAVSDRQAALFLVAPVQQRVVTADQLRETHAWYIGRRRRALVGQLIEDIADGAQSLGELDLAAMCRTRGLPVPERQVVVQGKDGRFYLDVRWAAGLVVEVDGSQHLQGVAPVDDMLRHNEVAMRGDLVLRVPLIGLRLEADAFLDQIAQALRLLALRQAS